MEEPSANEWQSIARFFLFINTIGEEQKWETWQNLYRRLVVSGSSVHTYLPTSEPVLRSHYQLHDLITELRTNPLMTLKEFEQIVFRGICPKEDKEHILTTIVWLGFMLDFRMKDNFSVKNLVNEYETVRGEPEASFIEFVSETFPRSEYGIIRPCVDISTISAWKLANRYNIKIEKTDNIAEHLLYHSKPRVLRVFHQIGYLRAQLRKYRLQDIAGTTTEAVARLGTLPPQLILEVLESFYLLFPVQTDDKGRILAFLKRLIDRNGFDQQASKSDSLYTTSTDFKYYYLADRLKDLSALAADPPPTNKFMSLMQRLSASNRAALATAIAALFLSCFFGFLGCLIGAAQLYVSIRAWQSPPSLVTSTTSQLVKV